MAKLAAAGPGVWAQMSPFAQYGVSTPAGADLQAARPGNQVPSLARSAGPSANAATVEKLWHPDNPLFWFGLLAAATFGLAGFSFSARVGKASGALKIGDT